MKKISRDAFSIKMDTTETRVTATVTIFDSGDYVGVATYHEGDVNDIELAGKIARSKAWRAYWESRKKSSLKDADSYKTAMNEAIDNACSYNKKVEELDEYIKKLTK